MRRRTHGPALRLEIVDWLLVGALREPADVDRLQAEGIAYDQFLEFDENWPPANLPALWREHRVALLAEARRRGIAEPWGMKFDDTLGANEKHE